MQKIPKLNNSWSSPLKCFLFSPRFTLGVIFILMACQYVFPFLGYYYLFSLAPHWFFFHNNFSQVRAIYIHLAPQPGWDQWSCLDLLYPSWNSPQSGNAWVIQWKPHYSHVYPIALKEYRIGQKCCRFQLVKNNICLNWDAVSEKFWLQTCRGTNEYLVFYLGCKL